MVTTKGSRMKHRSATITEGPDRAAARSYFYAMGLTREDMDKPFIGIANLTSDINPLQYQPGPAGPQGPRGCKSIRGARPSSLGPSQSATASPWAPRA